MEYLWLVVTGLGAGVLGGLLGIGGSAVMLPAMVWILGTSNDAGIEQIHQYMAAAMIVNFLLAMPSVVAHARNKAIFPKVWASLTCGALVGIVIGVQTSYMFRDGTDKYLRWAVGVFFVYVVGHNLYRIRYARRIHGLSKDRVEALPVWRKLLVGFPMGVIAGLLGLGGGTVAVPVQQTILKMPLRNAIATSSATILSVSWLGAILKNIQLGDNGSIQRSVVLAACLTPTAMIGAYIGGHLTYKLPLRVVRGAFIGIMILAAVKMFGWF